MIFAILPHDCEDGNTRWLEYVQVIETYRSHFDMENCWEGWEKDRFYPLDAEPVLG